MLPLVAAAKDAHGPGWCTYTYEHEAAPELEFFCGGVNSKTPKAAAVWRQGHLLHFGFEPSPDRMTEAGQALLVNSICYIARFTEDRPILHTPCGFVQGHWTFGRDVMDRFLTDPKRDLKDLEYYLAKETHASVKGKSKSELAAWYQQVRPFVCADAEGKLTVDADAESFGVSPGSDEFLAKTIAALNDSSRANLAGRLLARYVPDGPGASATQRAWQLWQQENQPYLFFSDTGGYRWYVDPLAKRRAIPTAQLRGPARATAAEKRGERSP